MRFKVHAMQLNQAPEAAAANRARIDAGRLQLIQKHERKLYQVQQRLAQCRKPHKIAKLKRTVEAAERRLAYVRINGSLPPKSTRKRQGWHVIR